MHSILPGSSRIGLALLPEASSRVSPVTAKAPLQVGFRSSRDNWAILHPSAMIDSLDEGLVLEQWTGSETLPQTTHVFPWDADHRDNRVVASLSR